MFDPIALLPLVPLIAWFVKSGPFPPIHEDITRAASQLVAAGDMAALIDGVRHPDIGVALTDHVMPDSQVNHSLRRFLWSSTNGALQEVRTKLGELHHEALTAATRAERWGYFGQALHMIQDSFSPAHAQRSGRTVSRLLNYGPVNLGLEELMFLEHIFPVDLRDYGRRLDGTFISEARLAVTASREYIRIALRHSKSATPDPKTVAADLDAFFSRWFSR
jgi:hypothetical protein